MAIKKHYVTVDFVLINQKEEAVALIKRKEEPYKGKWALPGGHLDDGESLEFAAVRELHEETGILWNDLVHFSKFYDVPQQDPRGSCIRFVYFGLTNANLALNAGDDAAEAKWFPIEQIRVMDLAFNHGEMISDILR